MLCSAGPPSRCGESELSDGWLTGHRRNRGARAVVRHQDRAHAQRLHEVGAYDRAALDARIPGNAGSERSVPQKSSAGMTKLSVRLRLLRSVL